MSQATTFQDLVLCSFNHSTHTSDLDKTNPLILRIKSKTDSLTQGRVEYSWLTHLTFIQVTFVHGIEDKSILLNEFPNVTP
jgi:hypothetical protein